LLPVMSFPLLFILMFLLVDNSTLLSQHNTCS
jgi:hypothetical protein